ncbi:MAG: DNA integrity scanning diadenylate cyclase DisA [Fusobacteriota bacterium]
MASESKLREILKSIAPGTEIRKGLDNILKAETGALIVIEENKELENLMDGGFLINTEYNPQKIYELAKMDGAIILNKDMNEILYANIQLQTDGRYKTTESGTRHRTAERVAKQTDNLTIAISQRRSMITIYKGNIKYKLRKVVDIISEVSQAVKTLERYKSVLNKSLNNLTIMEYDDLVTLYEVTMTIQRFQMLFRIADELDRYIAEAGSEGRLIKMQLEEILIGTEEEMKNLVRDYYNDKKDKKVSDILKEISELSQEELLEYRNISYILGYSKDYDALDNNIIPKGYRLLGKILKLTSQNVENIITEFGRINEILEADIEDLAEIKGITRFKARSIKNGLSRLKITTVLEK